MATVTIPCTDQEMPQANNHKDEPSREETQETTAQELDTALPDASLHECRVEMVPLDAIYTKSDPYDDELNDDLIKALAHSISLIGLQNPICIVANDIPDNPASYRLVSGRKRYAAFLKLERTTIPAHILSFAEADSEQEVRKALATTEENLVRKHYSLIELCELVGQSKAMYERIHPTTQKGKAKKPKHSGTERLSGNNAWQNSVFVR
jgi:ParB/Sulfiredoxin domain